MSDTQDDTINNVNDLRKFMLEQMKCASKGEITPAQVNAMSNLCGKILATLKLEHDHAKLNQTEPHLPFLDKFADAPLIEQKTAYNKNTGEVIN